MSEFNDWKKKRDQNRARNEREKNQRPDAPLPPVGREGGSSPSFREVPPVAPVEEPRNLDGSRRTYEGDVPVVEAPKKQPRRVGTANGCVGCVTLLFGVLVLVAIAGWIAFTFYWRQIEQRGAVNVLVLGVDERSQEEGPFRSDTMIMVDFHPGRREVALMSIPRDLWIALPDGTENRINTAYFFGGPDMAKQAVASNFGVPLSYYVKLNFDGFTSIIDAMGGITVNVPEALHDENYPTPDYGVTTIDIAAGEQTMDGATALIYARSRYSTSDFDRGRRQQDIIAGIQSQLLSPSTWGKFPAIFLAAQNSIATDIPINEWPALVTILMRSSVERVAIEHEDTQDFVTDGGAQVLLPVWENINPKLARYFE